jgi:hypothetical protein
MDGRGFSYLSKGAMIGLEVVAEPPHPKDLEASALQRSGLLVFKELDAEIALSQTTHRFLGPV